MTGKVKTFIYTKPDVQHGPSITKAAEDLTPAPAQEVQPDPVLRGNDSHHIIWIAQKNRQS